MQLRDYQRRSIDQLYAWFSAGNAGNPCIVLPTGSGKSHIIAVLCKEALQNWPETRILMLASQKELLEQNAEKLRQHWPGAPMGIYSAGIGKRQLGEPITFAGIQSVRNEVEVDEVGPSLRNATAKVTRTQRAGGTGGAAAPASAESFNDDPWAAASTSPAGGGWGTSTTDEPPF